MTPEALAMLTQLVERKESGGNPNAISPKGAKGRMQVMDETAMNPGYGVQPAADSSAAERERVGREYLMAMIDKYGLEKGLAAYNAGPGAVEKAGGVPDYPETQNYVSDISTDYLADPAAWSEDTQATSEDALADPASWVVDESAAEPAPVQIIPQAGQAINQASIYDKPLNMLGERDNSLMELARGVARAPTKMIVGGSQIASDVGRFVGGEMGQPYSANREELNRVGQELVTEGRNAPISGQIGELVGNVATGAMIPPVSGMTGNALLGGSMGALQPATTANDRTINTAMGLGGGALGGALSGALAKAPGYEFASRGVGTTPGQYFGGWTNSLEQKVGSTPFIGDASTAARARAWEEAVQLPFADALKKVGKTLPGDIAPGAETAAFTKQAIGAEFDKVGGQVPATRVIYALENIKSKALANAHPETARIVQNEIDGLMDGLSLTVPKPVTSSILGPTGTPIVSTPSISQKINASDLMNADSDIGFVARELQGKSGVGQRQAHEASKYLNDAQKEIRQIMAAETPEASSTLQAARAAWKEASPLFRAQSQVAAGSAGPFSPEQLRAQTRLFSPTPRKSAWGTGTVGGQDFATAAQNVFGKTVPNSGTTDRALGIGGIMVGLTNPHLALGAILGSPIMGSNVVRHGLSKALVSSSKAAKIIGGGAATGASDLSIDLGQEYR